MLVTNFELQASVRQALDWDLEVDARNIAVSTETGAVTLSGFVPSRNTKVLAVRTTQSVFGARAVADELEVHPRTNSDSAVAAVVARTLQSNVHLAKYNLKARIANGRVTLTGRVDRNDERGEAKHAVAQIRGVSLVHSEIVVAPRVTGGEVKSCIERALVRRGALGASHVHVAIAGSTAVLSGLLHSLDEARIARDAASRVPGITQVEDRCCIVR